MALKNASTYISGRASTQEAENFISAKVTVSTYISNRDLDPFFSKLSGRKALDFGSGLGFSTDFLNRKGFIVDGVDINQAMIQQAKKNYPHLNFKLTSRDEPIPFENDSFDLVFSSLVLFEMESLENLVNYLKEATRVLKDGGLFVASTGSAELYNPQRDWGTLNSDFPENYDLKSGKLVKIHLNALNVSFVDYYWTEEDYRKAFRSAGLHICDFLSPIGKQGEGYNWKDELRVAPYWVFVAAKNCQ